MQTLKTTIEDSVAISILKRLFHSEDVSIERIEGGERSQAFYTTVDGQALVARFNSFERDCFDKDMLFEKHLSGPHIPLIHTVLFEKVGNYYCHIARRVEGVTLSSLERTDLMKMRPSLFMLHSALGEHAAPGAGYGRMNGHGEAKFSSWEEYLTDTLNLFTHREKMSQPYVRYDIHERVAQVARHLLSFCPNIRHIVHGDFSFGNVLGSHGHITGLIDWGQAAYGDPLYDVAWMDFWQPGNQMKEFFKSTYKARGILPRHFDERIKVYKLLTAADGLTMYCYFTHQAEKYLDCLEKTRATLEEGLMIGA
jgi:hygromycin-B 4-O-kinase